MQVLEEHRDELGEPFLASCFAYLEKASKDQLDEIVLLIQRILQLYAARQWSQVDADGQHDALLQDVLTSDPQNWENMIHDLATSGVPPQTCRNGSKYWKSVTIGRVGTKDPSNHKRTFNTYPSVVCSSAITVHHVFCYKDVAPTCLSTCTHE